MTEREDIILDHFDRVREAKRQKADEYLRQFYTQYSADVQRWKLEPGDEAFLNLIVRGRLSGRALWCNRRVRKAAQHALIDVFLEDYRTAADRKRYWATVAWDLGISMEREPIIDFVALRNVAQHHLRRAGLEGFGIVELDVWKNLTGEKGRRIVAHVHFYGWAVEGRPFQRLETQNNMSGKRALINSIGAPSVVIKPVGNRADDAAHLGMYMMKTPYAAKNLVPSIYGAKLKSANLSRGSAARLVELLSRVEVGDVMFAIGNGKQLTRAVHSAIDHKMTAKRSKTPAPTSAEIQERWKGIRAVNGSKRFKEPVITTRLNQRSQD